ncbi:hypothetical protein HNQ43_001399 [Faecalicoccus acidiformans]|uniref:DUF4230 domain-containing protein n=1 Tax=Faecalicoccus acidiformans TaxID=915173 RepID=A0A7W8D4D8_9FIRM|nr:DUF4230 domain-containing protein [Faecalicoccus acidiformans]MBB5185345.1 hypothetical protein [Faecalicoccus acidiformans]
MKKILIRFLTAIIGVSCVGCTKDKSDMGLDVSQMKSICELATIECYYHNVAKYKDDDVEGILWWKKDRNFWMEYSGVVTVGIDISQIDIDVHDESVTITIPPAEILGVKVDETSLTEDSFVIAENSAKVEAEHQTEAFKDAQNDMEKEAKNNSTLLSSAQQRAQKLLTDYIDNIGKQTGKEYTITWKYIDNSENSNTE